MHNSSDNEKPNPIILISNGLVIQKQAKKTMRTRKSDVSVSSNILNLKMQDYTKTSLFRVRVVFYLFLNPIIVLLFIQNNSKFILKTS